MFGSTRLAAPMSAMSRPKPEEIGPDGNTLLARPLPPPEAPAHEVIGSAFARNPALRPSAQPSSAGREPKFRFAPVTGHVIEIPGVSEDSPAFEAGAVEIGVGSLGALAFMISIRLHRPECVSPWIEIPYAWTLDGAHFQPLEVRDRRFVPRSLRTLRLVLVDHVTGGEITARSLLLPEPLALAINDLVGRAAMTDYRIQGAVEKAMDGLRRSGWAGISVRDKTIGMCT